MNLVPRLVISFAASCKICTHTCALRDMLERLSSQAFPCRCCVRRGVCCGPNGSRAALFSCKASFGLSVPSSGCKNWLLFIVLIRYATEMFVEFAERSDYFFLQYKTGKKNNNDNVYLPELVMIYGLAFDAFWIKRSQHVSSTIIFLVYPEAGLVLLMLTERAFSALACNFALQIFNVFIGDWFNLNIRLETRWRNISVWLCLSLSADCLRSNISTCCLEWGLQKCQY